ncbi:hypothetical protein CHELA20_52324 [Hyphomicrobiales bacterium]|nr:hypothetical protein CHELA41_22598 [Hyphomicrobiales bacterium]CAH1681549.1 hypothetical protein CHELA20_52324 [Hyphomicrobiales bacterium]
MARPDERRKWKARLDERGAMREDQMADARFAVSSCTNDIILKAIDVFKSHHGQLRRLPET